MSDQLKLSPIEGIKTGSHFLRGTMPEELADGQDCFSKESEALLKHHGTYQQDDRDVRKASRSGGGDKVTHIFMVRTKIPGGRMTSGQLLAQLDLCEEVANTTLRITSRQGLQLHGVLKSNLKRAIARINEIQQSTLGACGDVNRNVMSCPAPFHQNAVRNDMQRLVDYLAEYFAPRTRAYHDLWLTDVATGEKRQLSGDAAEIEPIYLDRYLPRKFKMAVALPDDNCVDVYTNDLGFLAVVSDGRIVGYNVLAGGGQGLTPSAKKTFASLAQPICFVAPLEAGRIAEAIVKVQRDFGNREDRKQARLKYLIHHWGLEAFRAKVEEYYGQKLLPCTEHEVTGFDDHMGWHQQGDGRLFYGLNVENGRIRDDDRTQLKSALREVCRRLAPGIRLTAHQSLLFTDVAAAARGELEAILRGHGVPLTADISNTLRWSMACVAWPTCGLSITESERALPGIVDLLETELSALGLADEKFTLRMTGCPNGCARPYNSDIGLVGKAAGKYTIYTGGRLLGNRLSFIYKDMVPEAEVVPHLVRLFAYFKEAREPGESFGDFCFRRGQADLAARCGAEAAAK